MTSSDKFRMVQQLTKLAARGEYVGQILRPDGSIQMQPGNLEAKWDSLNPRDSQRLMNAPAELERTSPIQRRAIAKYLSSTRTFNPGTDPFGNILNQQQGERGLANGRNLLASTLRAFRTFQRPTPTVNVLNRFRL